MTPTDRYRQEFIAACTWSRAHALHTPVSADAEPGAGAPLPADCVDWAVAGPVLERCLAPYGDHEIAANAAAINYALLPQLSRACGCDFTLTLGWVETRQYRIFEHGPELAEHLLARGAPRGAVAGLPMHVWLTSQACEIVDVAMPLRVAAHDDATARQVFYMSNDDTEAAITYHPTVVGADFLLRIGAAVTLGTDLQPATRCAS